MKTQYYTATSIDGFIADDEHSLDWLFQFGAGGSEDGFYPRFISRVGATAMGSTTYEWVLRNEGMLEDPDKWPFDIPTWVFSSRELPPVPGADLRFVQGSVSPVHEEMAAVADGKNIWLMGGGDLVGQFHDRGLLDQLILFVAPVTLGGGAPLLPRRIVSPPLELVGVERSGPAFVALTYDVARES